MKKVFRLIIACICLVASGYMIKATREIFLIETTVYSFSYLIATLALIYLAYGLLDPILSPRNVDDEDIEYEPAQMSLLKDEPVKDINMPKISEEHNDGLNDRNKKKNSKSISTIIVIVIIFLFLKKCNSTLDYLITPSNEVYSTSQEWLDKDSMVKAALQTIAIESIKEVERVEIKLDYGKLDFLALNDGIDTGDIKYKYYYICKGQYTDKSNQTIHDFAIGVGFKDDAAMKEQSPYTVLYYDTK